jgi:hypothetical protein
MIPPFVQNIITGFQNALTENTKKLTCVDEKLGLLVTYQQLDLGKLGEDFKPRDANKLQYVREDTVNGEVELKIRDDAGYYPRDGYIANMGDEPFKVILFGVSTGDQTREFTVPPNVSYAIRSPISKIKITATQPTIYQVSVV